MFCFCLTAEDCEATYSLLMTETCRHHQQVPHQHKYRGGFWLCVYFDCLYCTDAQREVGVSERGGPHNKT